MLLQFQAQLTGGPAVTVRGPCSKSFPISGLPFRGKLPADSPGETQHRAGRHGHCFGNGQPDAACRFDFRQHLYDQQGVDRQFLPVGFQLARSSLGGTCDSSARRPMTMPMMSITVRVPVVVAMPPPHCAWKSDGSVGLCCKPSVGLSGRQVEDPDRSSSLDFSQYQLAALKTDQPPAPGTDPVIVPLLGLLGESGSVATAYKKRMRDGAAFLHAKAQLREELGDVLWYVAALADRFSLNLDDIAVASLYKAADRWKPTPGEPVMFDDGTPLKSSSRARPASPSPRRPGKTARLSSPCNATVS